MNGASVNSLGTSAMYYLDMGFPVVPLCPSDHRGMSQNHRVRCQHPGKAPRLENWQRFGSSLPTPEEIHDWWSRWPNANIGGPTGVYWGLALDIDPRHDGDLHVGGLERPIPDTVTNLTGGGGTHYLFRWPEGKQIGNRVGLFPGVDVRGIGGQIVLPASVHESGRVYEWEGGFEPWVHPLADPPFWLLEALQQSATGITKTNRSSLTELHAGVSKGQRNDSAARLTGRYLRKGLSREEVLDLLRSWNSRNQPPLDDTELIGVVNSIAKRHERGESEVPNQNQRRWSGGQWVRTVAV